MAFMTRIDSLLKRFEAYLKDRVSAKTAKKYRDTLKCIYNRASCKGIFQALLDEPDPRRQLDHCDALLDQLEKDMTAGLIVKSTKQDYSTVVNRLKDFLCQKLPLPVPPVKPSLKTKRTKSKARPYAKPCLALPLGKDWPTPHVSYDNVPEEAQVPQLCCMVEELYSAVLRVAQKLFGSLFGNEPGKIPVLLSDSCPLDFWPKDDAYIAEQLAKAGAEKGRPLTQPEILEFLQDKYFVDRVLGRFHAAGPYIEIFYLNFRADNRDEFFAMVANTLTHEYLHYLEHCYCSSHGTASYQNQMLSEAMADFFGVYFSIDYGRPEHIRVAQDRYQAWVRRRGSGWPYAEALRFYTVGGDTMPFSPCSADLDKHGSTEKLVQVFEACPDADSAYDLLQKL